MSKLNKCQNCDKPVEGAQYKFCYDCWWAQDPRNVKNGGTVDLKPTVVINSPSHEDTNETYREFKAEWEGCIFCACDHGCNQWLARNAAKILAFVTELEQGEKVSTAYLDDMAKKPAQEYGKELWQNRIKKVRAEMKARKDKNEKDNS